MVNGVITQYQVMWRRSHGESNYIQALPKEARQYTITGNKYKYNHLIKNMTQFHLIKIILLEYMFYSFLGLKPGEQYEVQVLGATQNGLPNVDFSWQIVELPPVNPVLPVPDLSFTTNADDQSIMVCIKIYTFCIYIKQLVFNDSVYSRVH